MMPGSLQKSTILSLKKLFRVPNSWGSSFILPATDGESIGPSVYFALKNALSEIQATFHRSARKFDLCNKKALIKLKVTLLVIMQNGSQLQVSNCGYCFHKQYKEHI